MIPKSRTLLKDDLAKSAAAAPQPDAIPVFALGTPITIKEVKCFNDFVAILQFRIQSSIDLGESGFKNEGMVVGFGPGIPGPGGVRCPSQLKLGDVVAFYGNPVTSMEPMGGLYKGQKIIIVPERNLLCGLPDVPFVKASDEQKSSAHD